MKLTKNIKVKIGEYVNKDGETKGRYLTVGRVLQKDDGSEMVLLDKTFNPAGVLGDKDSVILNFWEAEEKQPQATDSKPSDHPKIPAGEIPF